MQYSNLITNFKKVIHNNRVFSVLFFIILFLIALYFNMRFLPIKPGKEGMKSKVSPDYISEKLTDKEQRMFPFRYFQDENSNTLPIVAVTGFFRDEKAKQLYYEYVKNGITVFGITAYKSFPKKIEQESEDSFHVTDDFDYTKNIKYWLCCFRKPSKYGFNYDNVIQDISESDIYDIDDKPEVSKKYDFIYICNKDGDDCPAKGWNAINRNFKLARECFPILINDYKLKGLIVGRVGCGLEQQYGDKIEVTDFLDWHVLQEKMRESKFLFLPNVEDASPRVIAECITKGVPVLMNKSILCGSKYIEYETGEFFNDESDIRSALDSLIEKLDDIDPKKWWSENYGIKKTAKKIRNFLYPACKDVLEKVKEVTFIL